MQQSARTYATLKSDMAEFIDLSRIVLYPEVFSLNADEFREQASMYRMRALLMDILSSIYGGSVECEKAADGLFAKLGEIRATLETDIPAAYEGDPAAKSREEIMLAYPAFEAISTFRVAHELYTLGVPLLPRILTEMAHSETGIDIHPAAQIGKHFTIDHGTGVVIGATSIIGDNVKLYQGVTLGARSFPLDENGNPIKNIPRHPILEDDVIVYSNASILGRIRIGKGAVIGGNIWVTEDVPPGARIQQHRNSPKQN